MKRKKTKVIKKNENDKVEQKDEDENNDSNNSNNNTSTSSSTIYENNPTSELKQLSREDWLKFASQTSVIDNATNENAKQCIAQEIQKSSSNSDQHR